MSKAAKWAIGGVVGLAVVIGGGIGVIRLVQGSSPPPLHLSTTTPTTVAGQTVTDVSGTWKIGAGSQAGYRVGEVLFGQRTTAVGRTTGITGTLTVTISRTTSGTSSAVTAASFTVDLTTVSSDRSQRDGQFQGRIMETATYPTATFSLTQPITLASEPAVGATITEQATGDLTLHGTKKSVSFTVTARRDAADIQVVGSIPITFAQWNIPNPTFAGVAETDDHGTLEFSLQLTHA